MLDIPLDMQQVADEAEQETGIYKTPTSVKRKPKSPRKPRIYKPKEPKEPKEPKSKPPRKPAKLPSERKPPKPKNQTSKPHRDVVVRVPSDPNISKITGKPKRKYTRKVKPQELDESKPQELEQQETSLPVQEEVLVAESQPESCLEREPTYTLNFHHVSPQELQQYLYQLAKHRTFKLVTKQEQGEYVPAQVDEHGNTIVPSYIAAGRTVPAGQCSKCRANASPRIPIYYSTFETFDGWPLPYLCDRCYEVVRLWKWNAEFCEPLPMVLHYYEASMHESLHCKGLEE